MHLDRALNRGGVICLVFYCIVFRSPLLLAEANVHGPGLIDDSADAKLAVADKSINPG